MLYMYCLTGFPERWEGTPRRVGRSSTCTGSGRAWVSLGCHWSLIEPKAPKIDVVAKFVVVAIHKVGVVNAHRIAVNVVRPGKPQFQLQPGAHTSARATEQTSVHHTVDRLQWNLSRG